MKKLFLFLISLICLPCFAATILLPQQITCDEPQYCTTTDIKFKLDGWDLSSDNGTYIKPGSYKMKFAMIGGNPNDNFIKTVTFMYAMVDNDGYSYYISYNMRGWVVPVNPGKYIHTDRVSTCASSYGDTHVEDCYVTALAPGKK